MMIKAITKNITPKTTVPFRGCSECGLKGCTNVENIKKAMNLLTAKLEDARYGKYPCTEFPNSKYSNFTNTLSIIKDEISDDASLKRLIARVYDNNSGIAKEVAIGQLGAAKSEEIIAFLKDEKNEKLLSSEFDRLTQRLVIDS